jgi:integrase
VDRAVLECYLAHLHTEFGGRPAHRTRIGLLSAFFQAIRQHGWDHSLPTNTVFHSEDYPKDSLQPPRALSENVMAQLEEPANLDQWDNPAYRLVTIILIRCGLRVSDALKLPFDCLAFDADAAPYLRYRNHKMKREALVPIDEQLHQQITEAQRRLLHHWPDATPVLLPARSPTPTASCRSAQAPTGTPSTDGCATATYATSTADPSTSPHTNGGTPLAPVSSTATFPSTWFKRSWITTLPR